MASYAAFRLAVRKRIHERKPAKTTRLQNEKLQQMLMQSDFSLMNRFSGTE